jgi:hypothetical protein
MSETLKHRFAPFAQTLKVEALRGFARDASASRYDFREFQALSKWLEDIAK